MNTYSKLYLALLGQFQWQYLPTVPPEMILFPKKLFFNIYHMSSWTRAMLIPLAILARMAGNGKLQELVKRLGAKAWKRWMNHGS